MAVTWKKLAYTDDIAIHAAIASVHHGQLHAAEHVTGGDDVIANAIAAGASGLMTGADKTKLNGIEALADVTDFANVQVALAAASGAVAFNAQNLTGLGTLATAEGILTIDETASLSGYLTVARGDARYYTKTEFDTWASNVVQQEMDYLDGVSSDIQDQLDARCLESEFGTAISTGLVLDGTDLKASTVLQVYHGIDPTANVQSFLGAADYAAMMALLSATATATFSFNFQNVEARHLLLASNATDDTTKSGVLYHNNWDSGTETEGWAGYYAYASETLNGIYIGGNLAANNAATLIAFYTAANVTTRTGTKRMDIDASGNVDIASHDAATVGLQLGGTLVTASAAELNEAGIFFASTDISAAEAETLTDGSDADALHAHDTYALESVVGTSIGASLLLDAAVLKASTILQKYHAIDPAANVQSFLGAADYAAMTALLSATATAAFSMNTQKITNVVDPTENQEAATKKYVDDHAGAGTLASLTDTTITGPADLDLLQYDVGSSKWVDRSLAEIGLGTGSTVQFTKLKLGTASDYYHNDLVMYDLANNGLLSGLTIVSASDAVGGIAFADGTIGDDRYRGKIWYDHSLNQLNFNQNAILALKFLGSQFALFYGGMGVADYMYAEGGIHVGGTSDPGAGNLIVDGAVGCGAITVTAGNIYVKGDSQYLYLGAGNDFMMWFTGTHTYFRGLFHGANIYVQQEDVGGTLRAMVYMDPDSTTDGVALYCQGSKKLSTRTDGVNVAGKMYANGTTYYIAGGAAVSNLYVLKINEVRADDGTAADPSYTFDSDQDCGMSLASPATVGITTAGTLKFSFATYMYSYGSLRPSANNNWYLGGSSYHWKGIYTCALDDTTCAYMGGYSIEQLYNMFKQINPSAKGQLHYAEGSNMYFPHVDFNTLPAEFAWKSDVKYKEKKMFKGHDGKHFEKEVTFNKGDPQGIDRFVQIDALISFAVKLYEQNDFLKSEVKRLGRLISNN